MATKVASTTPKYVIDKTVNYISFDFELEIMKRAIVYLIIEDNFHFFIGYLEPMLVVTKQLPNGTLACIYVYIYVYYICIYVYIQI